MGRPKEHGDAVRAELLERASEIIRQEGVAALSLRRLASAANTSTRAIYSLFGGKPALLRALYDQVADTLATLHEAVPRDEDPARELLELTLAYRRGARQHPNLYPMLVLGIPGFSPTRAQQTRARRAYVRVLEAIARGQSHGLFPGRDVDDAGRELWALVHGLASFEIAGALGDAPEAEGLWIDAVTTMMRGFRETPGGNALGPRLKQA